RYFAPADGAVRRTHPGEEQAQVVVDLGDGANRGARVVRAAFLVDGDGRRQALDVFDIRLVHLAEELARIGRERLHVAALPFGEDGVESQRRLARAGQPGDDHELVAGDLYRDVLEIVFIGPHHA